jgi:hypothetical protein
MYSSNPVVVADTLVRGGPLLAARHFHFLVPAMLLAELLFVLPVA